ncbi:MAG: SHOCT domain-containing protein [Jiangellaceae bacterium]
MNDYPLLDLFFTMLWFFLFIAWIYLLVVLVTDVFRSDDLSGWLKALWTLFILILPILGALVYLIARGDDMTERRIKDYRRQEQAFQTYVRDTAGPGVSTADELTKLAQLRDAGTISTEEFDAAKAKLLT